MSTKEQERKALEQIKKIVASLGEDSYLATAFDGAFDDADENINYDAAFSWKNRAEVAWKEIARYEQKVSAIASKVEILQGERDTAERDKDAAERDRDSYKGMYASVCESAEALIKKNGELTNTIKEMTETLHSKDNEIIALKAKLYDLLIKE